MEGVLHYGTILGIGVREFRAGFAFVREIHASGTTAYHFPDRVY